MVRGLQHPRLYGLGGGERMGACRFEQRGPHGLSEMLYAFSSATGNNGSAFAGLTANTYWYNTTLGLAMLIGRFFMIVPVLALAGSLARKKRRGRQRAAAFRSQVRSLPSFWSAPS